MLTEWWFGSQVLEAEQHPRLANRALGWSRRKRDFEFLGREGVEGVLGEEGRCLKRAGNDT